MLKLSRILIGVLLVTSLAGVSNAVNMDVLEKYIENISEALQNHVLDNNPDIDISATDTANIEVNNSFNYVVDGVIYSSASTADVTFSTTAAQAGSTYCKYLVSVDADGVYTITKGLEKSYTGLTKIPALPDGGCPVGYILIATSTNSFTGGTSKLSSANVTDTYYDLVYLTGGSSSIKYDGF